MRIPAVPFLVLLAATGPAILSAERDDWSEGAAATNDGATREEYNRGGRLKWTHFMGDWRDASDTAQGDAPYAATAVRDDDTARHVEWDVTRLVEEWLAGSFPNQGFFLRLIEGRGTFVFRGRESAESDQRPRLVLEGDRGAQSLAPEADTYLDGSTYRSLGHTDVLKVSGEPHHALLRFDLDAAGGVGRLRRATLRLFTPEQYGGAAAKIGVFRCSQGHGRPPSEPLLGVAAGYPGDARIADDPAVMFAADFESDDWTAGWTHVAERQVLNTLSADPERRFEPLRGRALRVRIAAGANGALNTTYKFAPETGDEPEEIYVRYYLRLAEDWNQTIEGGKLPGISGTYGVAGWGGRPSDGTNGWSARGAFSTTIPRGNPLAGRHPIGTYCYHADMQGRYGNIWLWQEDYRGFLESNRWYSIEQYLKLNTPEKRDGIIRAWVDGRPAFEKTDIRFRNVDRLKIEQIWMNVYHGGTRPSPRDQHLYIDNVVIARRYIGPVVPTPVTVGRKQKSSVQVSSSEDGLLFTEAGRKVLFYQKSVKSLDGGFARSHYVHPLYGLDGDVLTEDFPRDHPHHRGIFWAWHQILAGGEHVADSWALKDFAWDVLETRVLEEDEEDETEDAAAVRVRVHWISPRLTDAQGKPRPLVEETSVLRVHAVREALRRVDFEIRLRALEDGVRIGGSEDAKGYGGFTTRVRLPGDLRFTGRGGVVEPRVVAVEAGPWIDFAGSLTDTGRRYGVTVLPHPSTPGVPRQWILRSSGSAQNHAYPGREAVALSTKEPLILRYRLLVHRGDLDATRIDAEARAYAEGSTAVRD